MCKVNDETFTLSLPCEQSRCLSLTSTLTQIDIICIIFFCSFLDKSLIANIQTLKKGWINVGLLYVKFRGGGEARGRKKKQKSLVFIK
jgi:hypothetical protein